VTVTRSRARSEVLTRIVSGLLLAGAALASAWVGGLMLVAFWAVGACGVLAEWLRMTRGTLGWSLLGILYAGLAFAAPLILRADPVIGLGAVLWLFAVVWTSDVMAYCCGRLIGGPKLWPAVSPAKTWAGFIGGTVFATAAATAVAAAAGAPVLIPVAMISLVAAVFSQAGDLIESAMKRRFGVKDAGHLIPGHGGMMDRLDGFIIAGAFALIVGLARGGWGAVGQGVLIW
jgi:phosphatidate cytidylyltransferase